MVAKYYIIHNDGPGCSICFTYLNKEHQYPCYIPIKLTKRELAMFERVCDHWKEISIVPKEEIVKFYRKRTKIYVDMLNEINLKFNLCNHYNS